LRSRQTTYLLCDNLMSSRRLKLVSGNQIAWPGGSVSVRAATESDRDFLRALFATTREQELAHLPGGAAARAIFCDIQFNAQRESYRSSFPDADHEIIEVNGVAAGRLYVDRSREAFHLIDISLLPQYRGRGIGGALLQALLAEAAQLAVAVSLSVAVSNGARRLYERLGFRTVHSDGVYLSQVADVQQCRDSNP
jgi:ribosomal protein S18 acetylase RimI-like enzyme